MYCSTCGVEATLDLNYCKRCGNSLTATTATTTIQPVPVSITGASWAMALAVVAMIGIIFGSVVNLADRGVSAVALTWMVIAGLGTVVGLVALIFRQLSRLFMANQLRGNQPAQFRTPMTSELKYTPQGALPQPAASVTENTTRFFEPAYKEPVERAR
jgi:hypothetical protein